MKRKIRTGVFETNSSSMHAICVSKDRINPKELDKKDVTTYVNYYGWDDDTLRSANEKASYLYAAIAGISTSDEEVEEHKKLIKNMLEKYDISITFKNLDEDEEYGCEIGVDHSYGLREWLHKCENDELYLLTFLFGDSFVVTGNDNGDTYFDRFYDYKEINTEYGSFHEHSDNFKSEYDNYEIYEKGN